MARPRLHYYFHGPGKVASNPKRRLTECPPRPLSPCPCLFGAQERYGKSSEAISELTNELGRVTEELAEVQRVLEERGSNISDTSPVVKIKEAINTLKVGARPGFGQLFNRVWPLVQ